MRKFYDYNNKDFIGIVVSSFSIADILKKIGMRPSGGNYATVKGRIKLFNIDISHFKGQGWSRGTKMVPFIKSRPMNDILKKDIKYNSDRLKRRLISSGYKIHKCEVCNKIKWMGKKINLELHHKNGDRYDQRINNLQLICPNCHSYTDNYRGKNVKIGL